MRRIVEGPRDLLRAWRDDAQDWCEDRSAWPRLPLLLYLVYAGVRHLADPMYRSWFAGMTLAFHEMGHIVMSPFGKTLHLLGGTLLQLVTPLATALYLLLRQRDHFGFAVGGAWLSFSLWEVATYVGDARREHLALVGFSANPLHDWSTLLADWGVLNHDALIAALVRVVAFLTWSAAVGIGSWLCVCMWRSR